ncbi:MAG: hypothetical protein E6Q29_09575 [Alicycliphilus sp.]|nr:MAG: hypothetical protein E6Q29_09575 [Alicycliphilus sp.]
MTVLDLKYAAASSASPVRVEQLPTNTTTKGHPVHRWFNFIAGFSPELVQASVAATGSVAQIA